jgi:hypothetical protein
MRRSNFARNFQTFETKPTKKDKGPLLRLGGFDLSLGDEVRGIRFQLLVGPPNLDPLPSETPGVHRPSSGAQQRKGDTEARQQNAHP